MLTRSGWIAAGCILTLAAAGTWQRNRVWHTEESLWRDVTLKSPKNGRGLMNYGLTQMSQGDYASALRYFEQARIYTPNYSTLEINIGIANGGMGRQQEAQNHFLRALALAPGEADPHYYYGRWLNSQGRTSEGIPELQAALQASPNNIDARHLLMQTYFDDTNGINCSASPMTPCGWIPMRFRPGASWLPLKPARWTSLPPSKRCIPALPWMASSISPCSIIRMRNIPNALPPPGAPCG